MTRSLTGVLVVVVLAAVGCTKKASPEDVGKVACHATTGAFLGQIVAIEREPRTRSESYLVELKGDRRRIPISLVRPRTECAVTQPEASQQ